MENKKISIAFVVIALSLILIFSENIESAYALSVHDVTQSNTPDNLVYITGLDRYISVNAGQVRITQPTTYSVQTSYSLVDTPDQVACSSTVCYYASNAGSNNKQFIIGFNPLTGGILSNATFDFSTGAYSAVNDLVGGSNSMVVSGSQVYAYAICDAGNFVMVVASGSSQAGLLGDCSGTNFGTGTSLSLVAFDNKIAITTDSASTNGFQIWLTSGGRVCQGASFTAGTAGQLAYSAETDKIYRATASSQNVDIMNVDTCVDEGNIASATTGLSTALRGIEVNDDRGEIYIQSTTTIAVVNLTSTSSLLYSLSTGGDSGTPRFKTAVSEEYEQVATAYGTNLRIFQLDDLPSNSTSGGSAVDGVCGVGTALECVGNRGTIGNIFYGTGGTAEPITATANNLLVGVGIVNSTNTDTETNGTGLFLMLVTGVFFFTVSVSSVAVANNKFNAGISYGDTVMNAYYLLFLVVSVLAIAFYLNWIPDLVFYGLVVGLAGLFSFGVYRHMARGG